MYFPIECTDSFCRELHEIASALGLKIDTAEEECQQSSSTQPQQQTYASIMLKQGFSTLQAGVSLVKSVVNLGIGEDSGVEVRRDLKLPTEEESEELQRAKADVKRLQSALVYSRNASDGGDKARRALKEAEEKVEALMLGSTPHKASCITLEEEASPPSSVASQACLLVKNAPTSSIRNSNSIVQYLTSSIPCTSLTRLNKEETFAEATSLPVMNVSSVERRGARCIKAEFGQLMQKVERLKGSGLSRSSTMGGCVENCQWVKLTGRIKPPNWLH